jgi:hypothetical protein
MIPSKLYLQNTSLPFAAPVSSITSRSTSTTLVATASSTRVSSSSVRQSSATPSVASLFSRVSSSGIISTPVQSSSVASPSACVSQASGFYPPAGSSCFKVIGHGLPIIEGKYLNKQEGYGSPTLGWGNLPASVFYIDSSGYMYESYQGSVMATDRTGGGAWMSFVLPQNAGTMPKAVCTMEKLTQSLSCYQTSTNVLTVGSGFSATDSRNTTPMFGFADSSFKQISLTYESAVCPAACSTPTPTPAFTPTPTLSSSPLSSSPTALFSAVSTTTKACTNPASGFFPPAGSSCFKVVGHGAAHVEGKYLSKPEGWANPVLGWSGFEPSTFYLDSNGFMYESYQGSIMSTDRTGGGAWMQFTLPQFIGTTTKAICTRNPLSKSLSCFQTSTDVITVESSFSADDSRSVTPMFGFAASNFIQISLTYEETACPALCPTSTPTPSPIPVSTWITSSVSSIQPSPSANSQCSNSISFVAPAGSTCFTVTGHGPSHVDGQLLGMAPGYSGAAFGWDNFKPATFYRDSDGYVRVASETGNGWMMATLPIDNYSPWLSFFPSTDLYEGKPYLRATCSLATQDKSLKCSVKGFDTFYVAPNKLFYSSTDTRSGMPIFGVPSSPWVSMTMSYNEVACPVKCGAISSAPLALSSPTPASSPQSSSAKPTSTSNRPELGVESSTSTGLATTTPSGSPISSSIASSVTPAPSSTSTSPSATPEAIQPCGGFSPGGNNAISGVTYNVRCGATGSSPITKLDAVFLPSFKACMESCNTKTSCKAVMFREIALVDGNYQCTRFSTMGLPQDNGLDWEGTFDVAYQVEPSAVPSK